jgi:hypothetical protein
MKVRAPAHATSTSDTTLPEKASVNLGTRFLDQF